MDAESQHLEELKARIAELEDTIRHKNQFIEELCHMSQQRYVIWSEEHGAWWSLGRSGYTRSLSNAGRYSKEEVREIITDANKYLRSDRFNEIAVADPL